MGPSGHWRRVRSASLPRATADLVRGPDRPMIEGVSDAQREGGPGFVQVTVEGRLPRADYVYVRDRIASLARYTRKPPQDARLTLRVDAASRTARRSYVADA